MFNKRFIKSLLFTCCLLIISTGFTFAQNKKNARPTETESNKVSTNKFANIDAKEPVYFYEFSKANFTVSKVVIEHDENGAGKITFQKKNYGEDIIEPLQLSEKTIAILKEHWAELKFLESGKSYQSKQRDYGHLGTIKLKMKRESKERSTEFNWTENLNAKALMDEYRKLAYQYVWMFDMTIARDNQPLESPKIMKRVDSYLRRNEISDPKHLMPYLKEISNDERFPMITRNHAIRLIKKIEKIK